MKSDNSMNKEWWYVGKTLSAIAFHFKDKLGQFTNFEENLLKIFNELPTHGTLHYGESPMIREDENGIKHYDNRVGMIHNYAAAWNYLAALFFYQDDESLNFIPYANPNRTKNPSPFDFNSRMIFKPGSASYPFPVDIKGRFAPVPKTYGKAKGGHEGDIK